MNAPQQQWQRQPIPYDLFRKLSEHFAERMSSSESICLHHGTDESSLLPMPPDAVVFAQTTEEVSFVARLCSEYGVPVIPYGTGTSLEGQVHALKGGICLDLTKMNQILAIRPDDLDATVEAGVTRKQLNANLHGTGLFFPLDPGADASVGGMASTRASGTNSVRYGTIRENVIGMTVVMANGDIIRTGGRSRKSAAGYDLTKLFIGAGGTLGIITELTVRLHPLPEAVSSAVCSFPTVDDAVRTVIQTIQAGVPVARIELLDALCVHAINKYAKTTMRELPKLFFEFHGSPASVAEQAETVQAIAMDNNGMEFEWATLPEERTALWQSRHDALYAAIGLRPGTKSLTTDVCVPISRLAECIEETVADLATTGLIAPLVGHVGDGNFHYLVLVDQNDKNEVELAEKFAHRLAERAIRMEGTCTGEHGIGTGKLDYMIPEHGEPAVRVMAKIKEALDPQNLLNPGKIIPPHLHTW
jgi:D-lactate dehydrogenase (cytochrome)